MNKAEKNYYYFLQRLEHEFVENYYRDMVQEFIDNKWVFHAYERGNEKDTYRWQYQKKHIVNVIVSRFTGKILEVIL